MKIASKKLRSVRVTSKRFKPVASGVLANALGAERVEPVSRETKQQRESAMLAVLCAEHGFAFQEPKGDKHTISMTAHTVSTMRRVSLLVPIDSALALGLDKLAKETAKAKAIGIGARREPKRRASRAKRSSLSSAEKEHRDMRWGRR